MTNLYGEQLNIIMVCCVIYWLF